jgi:hypothetical protein
MWSSLFRFHDPATKDDRRTPAPTPEYRGEGSTRIKLPEGGTLRLYEPRHQSRSDGLTYSLRVTDTQKLESIADEITNRGFLIPEAVRLVLAVDIPFRQGGSFRS